MKTHRPKPHLFALAVAALVAVGCSDKAPEPEIIRPVKAMQVGAPERLSQATFTGKAKALSEVDVAFEVPGRIIRKPVFVGDEVEEGQELAALDARDYANRLATVEAELIRATAQRDRIAKALESRAVAEQDLTDAVAAVDSAQALVDIAKKQLEDCVLQAPFQGTVVARYVENFENVLAKQKIMRLLDLSQIEMDVDVPENMIPNVPFVTRIEVRFAPFPELVVPATITEVGSEASQTTRTYPVTLRMNQPEGVKILAGMAGKARISAELPPERLEAGITVLASAVFTPDNSQTSCVWVIDESTSSVSRREVTVERLSRYGIVITSGLESGEWIVTAGVNSLVEGQKVRILQ